MTMNIDTSRLTQAIDNYYVEQEQAGTYVRGKAIGAGSIGDECLRKLAYAYRWHNPEGGKVTDGRILRLFQRGHREEEVIWDYFRNINVQIHDVDPSASPSSHNKQFRVKFADGHGTGFVDAFANNLSQFLLGTETDETFLLEAKTSNDKNFKIVKKQGVEKFKPEHYVQMLIYMWKYQVKHGLYCVVNKNTDELHFEYVPANDELAMHYDARALTLVRSETLPPKMSNDKSFYKCTFCNFKANCHDNIMPAVNCRTCAFATALVDQKWQCEHPDKAEPENLTPEAQVAGCDLHAYHPAYITSPLVEWDEDSTQNGYVGFKVKGTEVLLLNGKKPPVEDATEWRAANPVGVVTSSKNLYGSALNEVEKLGA